MHLLPRFGRMRLDRIDVGEVSSFIAHMGTPDYRREVQERNGQKPTATAGYSVQTIKSALIPLSRTMAYAKRNLGFAGENAVRILDDDEQPGYMKRRPKPRVLTRVELDRLIEHSISPWREMIATAAALGTRMGETVGLCWQHVDFDAGTVRIEQQANAKGEFVPVKTATGERTVAAPDWLMSMLRAAKLASPYSNPDDLVFPTRTGRPHRHGNVLSRGLYAGLRRSGLEGKASFHSLRHTHASLWLKDGGDVVALSKRLGHSTPQVTMTVYAQVIEEANDNAVRKARVNALYEGTGMAARMAASVGSSTQEIEAADEAEVVSLAAARSTPKQTQQARHSHQVGILGG